MKRLIATTGALIAFGSAAATEELFIFVPPEEAQIVVERDEMRYEEYKWYSLPNRIRIAKVNPLALREPAKTAVNITFFRDTPTDLIVSEGISNGRWSGRRATERVPKEVLKETLNARREEHLIEDVDRHYNKTAFSVSTWIKSTETDNPVWIPPDYKAQTFDERYQYPRWSTFPVVPDDAEVFYSISGTVDGFTVKPFPEEASEYVVIFSLDQRKNYTRMEPFNTAEEAEAFAQSEKGRRFRQLQNEHDEHMRAVKQRVDSRNKTRGESQ